MYRFVYTQGIGKYRYRQVPLSVAQTPLGRLKSETF